jgi:hypothetical protein
LNSLRFAHGGILAANSGGNRGRLRLVWVILRRPVFRLTDLLNDYLRGPLCGDPSYQFSDFVFREMATVDAHARLARFVVDMDINPAPLLEVTFRRRTNRILDALNLAFPVCVTHAVILAAGRMRRHIGKPLATARHFLLGRQSLTCLLRIN